MLHGLSRDQTSNKSGVEYQTHHQNQHRYQEDIESALESPNNAKSSDSRNRLKTNWSRNAERRETVVHCDVVYRDSVNDRCKS